MNLDFQKSLLELSFMNFEFESSQVVIRIIYRFKSDAVHNSNRSMISGGFCLLYAWAKGKSWINWGSKLALLIENHAILVRPTLKIWDCGMKDRNILIPIKSKSRYHKYEVINE